MAATDRQLGDVDETILGEAKVDEGTKWLNLSLHREVPKASASVSASFAGWTAMAGPRLHAVPHHTALVVLSHDKLIQRLLLLALLARGGCIGLSSIGTHSWALSALEGQALVDWSPADMSSNIH